MTRKITFIAIFVVVAVAICILASNTIFKQHKTGGSHITNTIVFQSLFYPFVGYPYNGGTLLKLNLNCEVPSGVRPMANQCFTVTDKEIPNLYLDYDQYANTDGMVALYEVLKDTQADKRITNIELIRERYILISTDIPDLRYVIIFRSSMYGGDSPGRGISFDYMPLQGRFFDQDIFTDISENYWKIEGDNVPAYVPYHLFDDHLLFYQYVFQHLGGLRKNYDLSHQIGHYYKIYGDIADFKAFYESLDMYEITEESDSLIIKGVFRRRNGDMIGEEGKPSNEVVSPVNCKMILKFKEEDGQRYVAYSFETELT